MRQGYCGLDKTNFVKLFSYIPGTGICGGPIIFLNSFFNVWILRRAIENWPFSPEKALQALRGADIGPT